MADCTKDSIPEEIIEEKGKFHCRQPVWDNPNFQARDYCVERGQAPYRKEFLPTQGDVIAKSDLFLNPNFISFSYPALVAALGETIALKNVVFEDEFMSWESEPIKVADAPVQESLVQTWINASCGCCGKNAFYSCVYEPDKTGLARGTTFPNPLEPNGPCRSCGSPISSDVNPFTGQSVNTGWFGTTLQFYFNIYKVYCCTRNANDEIIDYDYSFYFVTMHKRDGVLCLDGYDRYPFSPCVFCYPNIDNTPPGIDPMTVTINSASYLLPGIYYVPVEPDE